ncbi:MAG: hypothetical protein LQ351_003597 [Letrouitia transgressa]|nr:MAG: hypothetical protein LQ351_003597 [Letrouitia transgressa]
MASGTRKIFSKVSCYGNFHSCITSAINTINTFKEINVEELIAEDRNCSICNQPFNKVPEHEQFVEHLNVKNYHKTLHKPVQLPCGHIFCKSCIFLWLRPLDNEAPVPEPDGFESDEDAESEIDPEDLQMTERDEVRRSINGNEASDRENNIFGSDEGTESEANQEDSPMTEMEETQRSTNENASDNNAEEDRNSADNSNEHQLIDERREISPAAASPNINGRHADEREVMSLVEEYRTSENRRHRPANNTCPLCRSELFPKPCHSGSCLVLMAVVRLFDAAYCHLDIELNENEQRSRKNFVDYLGFDLVARERTWHSLQELAVIRVYTFFEAMNYMRAMIVHASSDEYEANEFEFLAELSDFIYALESKIGYFNLYRDPFFLLHEFRPSSYRGLGPRERRNAICDRPDWEALNIE